MGEAVSAGMARRWLWATLPLALAGALAGCGSGNGPSTGGGDAAAILADWQSFPVATDPRPLVLTGPTILDPLDGFPEGDSKEAYVEGRFEVAVALPAGPASSDGYPILSAQGALERFRSPYPVGAGKGARTIPRLRIIAVALGQASFDTDRGARRLPAWRFSFQGVAAPAWALAVGPKALWTAKPISATDLGFRATPTSDDRSLTPAFIGGPDQPTPCGIAYSADAVESATAVVVVLHQEHRGTAEGQVACDSVGYPRTASLRLAAALGSRVLLSPSGLTIPVVRP